MLTLILACTTTPPDHTVQPTAVVLSAPHPVLRLSEPTGSLQHGDLAAQVIPWSRGDHAGRIVLARIAPAARADVLASEAPVPLQELLPSGEMVAINGGFYDEDGAALGLLVSDGVLVNPLRAGGGSGVLLLSDDGPRILYRDRVGDLAGVTGALQSIDRLVSGGESLVSSGASPERDARSAVAVTEDHTLLFAVLFDEEAVGREAGADIYLNAKSSSTGVSLAEWADLLVQLGADTALNLDGGYSTSIHIQLDGTRLDVHPHGATINSLTARNPAASDSR